MSIASWRLTGRRVGPAVPALAFLAVFFAVPVFEILRGGLLDATGHLSLAQFHRMASNAVYAKVLWITFVISALTALLSVVLGYPVAYALCRMRAARRNRWLVWLLIPFWTSYLVKTFAWILVLSRTGVLASAAMGLGLSSDPASMVPSLGAVLVGMVHAMLPLAVMTMLPIMLGINAQLSQAAETLGASAPVSFTSVFLPLSAPGVAAAGLLVFITSLGFFIVPTLLGTPRETMISQLVITSVMDLFNLPFAGALSIVMLVCAIVVFVLYDRLVGLSSLAGETSAGQRATRGAALMVPLLVAVGRVLEAISRLLPRTNRPDRPGRGANIYAFLLIALMLLPILVVLPIAFTRSSFLAFPPQGFSLRWFETFMTSPIWQAAWLRSLGVASATALAAVALGMGASFALMRLPRRWTKPVFAFLIAPLIVPRVVLAVGLFYLYATLGLSGTNLGLIIGHTVLAIPYVIVTMSAALKRFDWRLDDAARMLGASSAARLRTVLLPLLAPSLVSAALFAFITSFDDLSIAIFVSGGLKTTLPKQMWDDMQLSLNPTLAAVAVTLTVLIVICLLIPLCFKRKD